MKDFYDILGVPPDAPQADIKAVYRKKMLEYHPDRNPSEEAQEKAKAINEAFSVVGDSEKRKQYDMIRSTPRPAAGPAPGFDPFSGFDFFKDFMKRQAPPKGSNIQTNLEVSLYESIFGVKKEVQYGFTHQCEKCVEICSSCGGSGRTESSRGNFFIRTVCGVCRGAGSKNKGCDSCTEGLVQTQRSITVSVPPGVKDGTKLGLAGAGIPGGKNRHPGDLIVVLSVKFPAPENFSEEQKNILKDMLD